MMPKNLKIILLFALCSLFFAGFVWAQTSVTLISVSPTSSLAGAEIVVNGSNLLQCAPVFLNACNVQFHDINLRRYTVSGAEESNSQVRATVPTDTCPGSYSIKVGEVDDFSNSIPFTVTAGAVIPAGCRVIDSIYPTSGPVGTSVTINGRNLHSNVQLYNSAGLKTDVAGSINAAATQVIFTVPIGTASGTYSVRVGPNVNDVSNGLPFIILGDTVAPLITNIRVTNITTSSATVLWDTSELADGQIELCQSLIRCGINTPLISALTTSHVVDLSGLEENTRYYFWIKSKDSSGNLATVGSMTFRTLSDASPTPTPSVSLPPSSVPVISNIQISNITRDSATVTWDTDRPADSKIASCIIIFCFASLLYDSNLVTSHTFTISELSVDKTYYIQIKATDNMGSMGSSSVISFETQPGLVISNIKIINITTSSLTISWDTNYPADSRVKICSFFFWCFIDTGSIFDPKLVVNHAVNILGLQPNSLYYYRIVSKDTEGYVARSRVTSFRIAP